MAIPKHEYIMDYIDDPDVFKAVMFAKQMIRDGSYASNAIRKAAYTYKVDMTEVAKYVGQSGGRKASETPKTRKRKPKQAETLTEEYWFKVENHEKANEVMDFIQGINWLWHCGDIEPWETFKIYVEETKKVRTVKGIFSDDFLTTKVGNGHLITEIVSGIAKAKRNGKGEIVWHSTIY